ncbi:MAG: ABC transporter ATP-binding protein, partial [bacterium]
MSAPVEFVHVWKKFKMGEVHSRLRDAIPALIGNRLRRAAATDPLTANEFWALSDVNFQVRPGEALGIIGPNGAGKSTVLKLLTRIMHPTAGECRLTGRVGALIEVAAGFHPDLTGRENVYLQGVIMGMPRREIARKFDQIVAFADLAPFIDTPVKRYSTGMQARLGFAVAAHLEPEVLLIDEVLSVGDAAFQAKAYARASELVRQEIPVVMVSHQLEAVAELCTQAILLDRGRVIHAGTPRECITAYLHGDEALVRKPVNATAAVTIQRMVVHQDPVEAGGRVEVDLECSIDPERRPDPESIRIRLRAAQTRRIMFETSTLQLQAPLPASGTFGV